MVRPSTSDRALAHVAHKLRTTHGVHKAARVPVFLTRTNQFDNTANRDAHYASTGPEIWEQLNGRVDGFTCSTGACVRALPLPMRPPPARRPHLRLTRACTLGAWARGPGTGGTLAGTARYLKERNPAVKVFLADPPGSVLYRYFKSGRKELERTGTGSITEGDCLAAALLRRRPAAAPPCSRSPFLRLPHGPGIGQGRVTDNMKGAEAYIDDALHIPDEDTIDMVRAGEDAGSDEDKGLGED